MTKIITINPMESDDLKCEIILSSCSESTTRLIPLLSIANILKFKMEHPSNPNPKGIANERLELFNANFW